MDWIIILQIHPSHIYHSERVLNKRTRIFVLQRVLATHFIVWWFVVRGQGLARFRVSIRIEFGLLINLHNLLPLALTTR